MASQPISAATLISAPALDDVTVWVDTGQTTRYKIDGTRLGGLLTPQVCQGRLTTESGVPVSTSDRLAQGTLYWTPCTPEGVSTTSGLVGFYDGTRYVIVSLTELSLNLATAESGGPIDINESYDVFLDYNAGTPALVIGPQWSSNTARATALAKQGSLIVLTGDTDWRWVGTIRASASGQTEDSGGGVTTQVGGRRFVWNAFNKVPRSLAYIDTTDSWTYTTQTVRLANNVSSYVEWVTGDAATQLDMFLLAAYEAKGTTTLGAVGIGIDSNTAFSGARSEFYNNNGASIIGPNTARYVGYPGLGYHYASWLELGFSGSTSFFYGDDGGSYTLCGLRGTLLA